MREVYRYFLETQVKDIIKQRDLYRCISMQTLVLIPIIVRLCLKLIRGPFQNFFCFFFSVT